MAENAPKEPGADPHSHSPKSQGQSPRTQHSPRSRGSPKSQSPRSQGQSPPPPGTLVGEGTLQAEDDVAHDQDSAYNESTGHSSYVTSLKSGIANYTYENGRRYHAFRAGTYLVGMDRLSRWLTQKNKPNDEEEQDRMDLVHHLYRLMTGGPLFFAPIGKNPHRVLDLGTGTGIWAMDFADEYPSAEAVGIDLSPIQPKWVPPNCTFEVDDYEDEWLYRTPFDFIHGRELEGCIANDDKLIERALEHLAPGGYLELQATSARFTSDDGTHEKAKNANVWLDALFEGAATFGKPLDIAPKWKAKVEEKGFEDVQEKVLKLPVGSWPKDSTMKEIGVLQYHQQLQAVDSYTPGLVAKVLGWSDPEVQVLMAKVKSELKDPTIHLYLPVHFVWGRKPL